MPLYRGLTAQVEMVQHHGLQAKFRRQLEHCPGQSIYETKDAQLHTSSPVSVFAYIRYPPRVQLIRRLLLPIRPRGVLGGLIHRTGRVCHGFRCVPT